MKQLLLLLFMLNTSILCGQNYIFDKTGGLVWQNIYDTDMTSDELYKSLHSSPYLHSVEKVDSTFFVAKMRRCQVNYEKLGYKRMQLPLYLTNSDVGNATVIVQYKKDRYRIRLMNIDLIPLVSMDYGTLNDMAIAEDGYFTDTFKATAGHIYHKTFLEWFELEQVSNDW